MKAGARVLGVAESYTGDYSTLAGALVTVAGRFDDLCFGSCTVGGTDGTEAIVDLVERLDREDISAVLIAGVALAWYNIVDLDRLSRAIEPPVIAVTFETSDGLEPGIEDAFEGSTREDRLERYHALPPRHPIVPDSLYVRSVDLSPEDAGAIVTATTPENAPRPDPLRVANIAAQAADEIRT